MAKKDITIFTYAITEADTAVFDALVKDFDGFDQELKDEILTHTVMNAPDTKFIEYVIEKCCFDLGYKDEDGATLLHWAAASNYPETVKFFLAKGLDIEAKTSDTQETPLLYAAKYSDNPKVLQALIDAGADTEVCNIDGENLLIAAAGRNPCLEVTHFLLKLGFDTEVMDNEGFTPILNAARWQSNTDVITLLVEAGADTNARTSNGNNMFHLAAYNNCSAIAGYIQTLFTTSQLNEDEESCLETALLHAKNPMVLNYYLTKMKREHVTLACMNDTPEILEALLLSGCDANLTNEVGCTPLMLAAKLNSNPNVIKMLLFYDTIWNCRDYSGRNALHYAAANTAPAIYNWMLEHEDLKTLADQEDKNGNKPEYYLAHKDKF